MDQLLYILFVSAHPIVYDELHISFFLLPHVGMDERNFAAEKNLENRSRSSFGNDDICSVEQILREIYEAMDLQRKLGMVRLDFFCLSKQFLIFAADDDDVHIGLGPSQFFQYFFAFGQTVAAPEEEYHSLVQRDVV